MTVFLCLIRQREVLHPFLPAERRQIIIEILAERPVGEPEEFEMKPFEALAEHLQLAKKTELLKLDVAEQAVRFGQMQNIEQERPVDRNLMRLAHRLEILRLKPVIGRCTIDSDEDPVNSLPLDRMTAVFRF